MRYLVYIFVLLCLFGCKNDNKYSHVLTDKEWHDIIAQTFLLSDIKEPYIFQKYDNTGLKKTILDSYINSTFLGYEINDSILNYINTREDKPITNHLDTMFAVSFITDTIRNRSDYVLFSEPFFVNDKIICIAMSNRKIRDDITLKKVFYFIKRDDKVLRILGYYDVNKDVFYKATPISYNSPTGSSLPTKASAQARLGPG